LNEVKNSAEGTQHLRAVCRDLKAGAMFCSVEQNREAGLRPPRVSTRGELWAKVEDVSLPRHNYPKGFVEYELPRHNNSRESIAHKR